MPWIELDGVVNIRELGGQPAGDGRETAGGGLLREGGDGYWRRRPGHEPDPHW
jgi:hypothetical protein